MDFLTKTQVEQLLVNNRLINQGLIVAPSDRVKQTVRDC